MIIRYFLSIFLACIIINSTATAVGTFNLWGGFDLLGNYFSNLFFPIPESPPDFSSEVSNNNTYNPEYWYNDSDMNNFLSYVCMANEELSKRIKNNKLILMAPLEVSSLAEQLQEELNRASLLGSSDQASLSPDRTILIPLNINFNHWVGLVIRFGGNNTSQPTEIIYMDSLEEHKTVPKNVELALNDVYGISRVGTAWRRRHVQTDYSSCGPYTIQNLLDEERGISPDEQATLTDEEVRKRQFHLAQNMGMQEFLNRQKTMSVNEFTRSFRSVTDIDIIENYSLNLLLINGILYHCPACADEKNRYYFKKVDLSLCPKEFVKKVVFKKFRGNFIITNKNRIFLFRDNGKHLEIKNDEYLLLSYPDEIDKYPLLGNFQPPNGENIKKTVCFTLDGYDKNGFIITSKNRLFAFGKNSKCKLGVGNEDEIFREPKEVKIIGLNNNNENIEDIIPTLISTFIITDKGRLFVVGNNSYGQLGLGNNTNQGSFVEVKLNLSLGECVKSVTPFANDVNSYTFIITNKHRFFAAGGNKCGQLGLGNTKSPQTSFVEVKVDLQTGEHVEEIVLEHQATREGAFCFIITNKKRVFVAGKNFDGVLGLGEKNEVSFFEEIGFDLKKNEVIIGIVLHANFPFFITNFGRVFVSGYCSNGGLGLGKNKIQCFSPEEVKFDLKKWERILKVKNTYTGTFFITNYGKIFATGFNINGALGLGNKENQFIPQEVPIKKMINENIADCNLSYEEIGNIMSIFFDDTGDNGFNSLSWYLLSNNKKLFWLWACECYFGTILSESKWARKLILSNIDMQKYLIKKMIEHNPGVVIGNTRGLFVKEIIREIIFHDFFKQLNSPNNIDLYETDVLKIFLKIDDPLELIKFLGDPDKINKLSEEMCKIESRIEIESYRAKLNALVDIIRDYMLPLLYIADGLPPNMFGDFIIEEFGKNMDELTTNIGVSNIVMWGLIEYLKILEKINKSDAQQNFSSKDALIEIIKEIKRQLNGKFSSRIDFIKSVYKLIRQLRGISKDTETVSEYIYDMISKNKDFGWGQVLNEEQQKNE